MDEVMARLDKLLAENGGGFLTLELEDDGMWVAFLALNRGGDHTGDYRTTAQGAIESALSAAKEN